MTTYTFVPKTDNLDVDWSDPTIWSGGVVPNGPGADVVVPEIDPPGQADADAYRIALDPDQSYAIGSLSIAPSDELLIGGTLSVAGTLSLSLPSASTEIRLNGGSLSVGTLQSEQDIIIGSGTIASASGFANAGEVDGAGLTLTVPTLHNTGLLFASSGNLIVDVTGSGGDADLSDGTLTGGTYRASGGVLQLDIGGAISTSAATILLDPGGSIETVDPSTGDVVALQSSLRTIASTGSLYLDNTTYASTGVLTVDGLLALSDAQFSVSSLDIATGAAAGGSGTLSGPITNDGAIVATAGSTPLVIDDLVTGTGRLIIGSASPAPIGATLQTATLQLDALTSLPVIFDSGGGSLVLADPQAFVGSITPAAPQSISENQVTQTLTDDVVLAGFSIGGVTGETYSDEGEYGTLTITEGSASQRLVFIGNFDTASFALSAGPTVDGSTSLQIAVTPLPLAPSLALAANPEYQGIITDDTAPSVIGTTSAGTTVQVQADGTSEGSAAPQVSGDGGSDSGNYQITLSPPLAPGGHTITATATNSAGSTAADEPLYLFTLPGPVDGIVTADVSSAQVGYLLDNNYTMQFIAGTQAIQLTDGTLSVGTNTGAAFMQRLYEGLLGRSADTGGLAGYNQVLNQQGPAAVASDILASAEFTQRNGQVGSLSDAQYVTFLYQGLLGRAPEASSLANDTEALTAGVSRGALAASIATSAESESHFAAATANVWVPNPTNALITQLYETALGRVPDLPGLAGDAQALVAGASMLQIADSLAASPEFRADHAGQSAAQLVTSFYANGLDRLPDPGGLQTYTDVVQSGAGTGAALLAIASSTEATGHLLRTV